MGCWQTFRFFMKHSFRDVGRHKCHFCLALCSVLIVVLSTLVVNTVIAQGPVIFLKLGEQENGEIDATYVNSYYGVTDTNFYWNDLQALNYTRGIEVLEEQGIKHHMSPRFEMCPNGH